MVGKMHQHKLVAGNEELSLALSVNEAVAKREVVVRVHAFVDGQGASGADTCGVE